MWFGTRSHWPTNVVYVACIVNRGCDLGPETPDGEIFVTCVLFGCLVSTKLSSSPYLLKESRQICQAIKIKRMDMKLLFQSPEVSVCSVLKL